MTAVLLARNFGWMWLGDFAFPAFRSCNLPECTGRTIGLTGEFSIDAGDGPAPARNWFILDRTRMSLEWAGDGMGGVFKLVRCFRDLSGLPRFGRPREMLPEDETALPDKVEVAAMMATDDIPAGATACCPVNR